MQAIMNNSAEAIERGGARLPAGRLRLAQFSLHPAGTLNRQNVERYIGARFQRVYGAQINHFQPQLITLTGASSYCAAVGLAAASSGKLFAETYLRSPIEQLIAEAKGEPVGREQILEIGNLVSTWKGSGLLLFVFLSELIERLGYRWVVFTATRHVERLLGRLHYAPVVLADADPGCLPDGGASWGSYYQRQPRVMFGEVRPAVNMARKGLLYRSAARVVSAQVDRVVAEFRQCPAHVIG